MPVVAMSKYLVECNCGNKLPVEVGQAGGRITCSCGSAVDVPTLRKLRHLPLAEVKEAPRNTVGWGARQGIMTASLVAVGALVAAIAYSWITQPTVPKFEPVAYEKNIERILEKMSPVDAWNVWVERYRPLAEHGFMQFNLSNQGEIERQIVRRQSLRGTLWIVAGVFAAVAAATFLWPRPQHRR